MFDKTSHLTGWQVLRLIPMILVMSGCASRNINTPGADAGLVLKYHIPQERVLQYSLTSSFSQNLEVRGQSFEVTSDDIRSISLRNQGRDRDMLRIGVTIDSMRIEMETPQGIVAPDLKHLVGEAFEFNLSTAGRETGFTESESLDFDLLPGMRQNAVLGFQAFFPDLPSRPVKVGDTWISKDTVTEKTSRGELRLIFEYENKLEGFETVDDMKCAKIKSVVKGKLDGIGEEMGMELISRADIAGTDIWYFAYEEGILIMSASTGRAQGKITGQGPEEIEIPMTREYSMETRLLK